MRSVGGAGRRSPPLVVLGAGYAGLTLAQEVASRAKGRIPVVVVDRHPVHVLRTELYEVGGLAAAPDGGRWVVPLERVFDGTSVDHRTGTISAIDFAARTVRTEREEIPFGALAVCLGSAPAYFGVPGAAEHTHQVYGLLGAQRLARSIRQAELDSVRLPPERRPRVVVVGGGSTGTELAADIATTDWREVSAPGARRPEVVLVTGALPFLAGLPPALVRHAEGLLRAAGVNVIFGLNTTRVDPHAVALEDGTVLACDIAVWCAGVEAPSFVRSLPLPHGKGGRIAVGPTLEVPGFPDVYAVGDVAELRDPRSRMFLPATAQVAMSEARHVAQNLIAKAAGQRPRPFTYRERGVILAVGRRRGAASLHRITFGGSPASWLKRLVEREYANSVEKGTPSGLL